MSKQKTLRELLELTLEIIHRKATLITARKSEAFFTRERVMGFTDLVQFVLHGVHASTACAVRRYLDTIGKGRKRMSQQALSKARAKFDHTPFETMVRETVQRYYSGEYDLNRWQGYLLLAIDSSTAGLPDDPALLKRFGGCGRGATAPTARISILYDVTNPMILDAAIERIQCGERELAARHIEWFEAISHVENVVYLFDRGYPSEGMLEILRAQGRLYVMRVSKSSFGCVQRALDADQIVRHSSGMDLRVLRFLLPSGEEECLITNLYELPFAEFEALYFKRWPIETEYSLLKEKLVLEGFSGRSENVILQDFWACIHVANLCAVAKSEADEAARAKRRGKENKYEYVANMNEVIGLMRDHLIAALVLPSVLGRARRMNAMVRLASRCVVPVRPGRSRERPEHPRVAKARFNRKVNL